MIKNKKVVYTINSTWKLAHLIDIVRKEHESQFCI